MSPLLLLMSLLLASSMDTEAVAITPVCVWNGTESSVTRRAFHLCRSQGELAKLWKAHTQDWPAAQHPMPEVDFKSHDVVGIFLGKGCDVGLKLISIEEKSAGLTIRFRPIFIQQGITTPLPSSTSYLLILLRKTEAPITIEENVQSLIGEPPIWEAKASLK